MLTHDQEKISVTLGMINRIFFAYLLSMFQ
jgi:hypothetical protein